jgi:hypothetical protein
VAPAVRFPRLERYVSRLPQGLDSYPACGSKASVYRTFTDSVDLTSFPFDEAPPAVRALLKHSFLHTSWLATAHVMATVHAVADFLGLDDEATVRWMDETNGRLLSGRVYRALMSLTSPAILLVVAARQWGILHRGTKFTVVRGTPHEVRIDYPEYLYDEVSARGVATGLRHALHLSRAKNPSVELESYTPTKTTYRVIWT